MMVVPSSYGRHGAPPHSQHLSLQQLTNILCDRTTLLKLEKNIILTNVYYTLLRSRRINKLLRLMFTSHYGMVVPPILLDDVHL